MKRVRLSDLVRFDVQDGPNELTPPEVESVVYKFLRTFAVTCSQVNLFLVIGRRFAFLSVLLLLPVFTIFSFAAFPVQWRTAFTGLLNNLLWLCVSAQARSWKHLKQRIPRPQGLCFVPVPLRSFFTSCIRDRRRWSHQ